MTMHLLHTSSLTSGRLILSRMSRVRHTSHVVIPIEEGQVLPTTSSPEPIAPSSSPRNSTIPIGSPGSPNKNRSPAPKQTFHKDKHAGFHYLTDTHLLQGVSGAAHFSSAGTCCHSLLFSLYIPPHTLYTLQTPWYQKSSQGAWFKPHSSLKWDSSSHSYYCPWCRYSLLTSSSLQQLLRLPTNKFKATYTAVWVLQLARVIVDLWAETT